jgi:multidrug transporter EmrE-like cation transporter
MPAYLLLSIAIIAEVVATNALKASEGFTKPGPAAVVVVGYGVAFFILARVMDQISVGVAYAIWAGGGIALVALVAWGWFGQRPDLAGFVGIGLIVAGVLVLNLLSTTTSH